MSDHHFLQFFQPKRSRLSSKIQNLRIACTAVGRGFAAFVCVVAKIRARFALQYGTPPFQLLNPPVQIHQACSSPPSFPGRPTKLSLTCDGASPEGGVSRSKVTQDSQAAGVADIRSILAANSPCHSLDKLTLIIKYTTHIKTATHTIIGLFFDSTILLCAFSAL